MQISPVIYLYEARNLSERVRYINEVDNLEEFIYGSVSDGGESSGQP